uniref:Peroxidase n=1 Tax=Aegilops tauschii subsp. strangulata TaxID=200361 RepID=A0A453DJS1_AEGTS
ASAMASRAAAAVAVLALVCAAVHSSEGQLSPNFHAATCPDLEHIVEFHVAETFRRDVGVAPALIRILFHDCFPQGCDASVLLKGAGSELNEVPNQTLRPVALDLIERIRAAVHSACGPTVSGALLRRADPHLLLRQPQPRRGRPGVPLRRAHLRRRPLPGLRGPLQASVRHQPGHRLQVRDLSPEQVRRGQPRRHPHAEPRRAHAGRVRQQVLLRPDRKAGAVQVGPGPHRPPHHQAHGHPLLPQPGRLLRAVRQVHDQDEQHGPAHRQQGRDPEQLRRPQQACPGHRDRRHRRRGDRRRHVRDVLSM